LPTLKAWSRPRPSWPAASGSRTPPRCAWPAGCTAELLHLAGRFGLDIRPVERAHPDLLHGSVALALARDALGIDNPAVTSAVLYHTTGHPEMSSADRVFYLADLVEPSRAYGWVDQVRRLLDAGSTRRDLDIALLFAITHQLRRLLKHGAIIDPRSIDLYNRLRQEGIPLISEERTPARQPASSSPLENGGGMP
jgi:HD superfamily phosphohydrolase YqeK